MDAGVGRDGAGISGLALAERFAVPAVAVDTFSARIGDGDSVFVDGVVSHVNDAASAFGVAVGARCADAARRLLAAPRGRPVTAALVDRRHHIAVETPHGRIVLMGSTSFATEANRRDVLCVGSHGGAVNARPLLSVGPRGIVAHDAGMARERSGASGLPLLEEAGIAAAVVDGMSARIGDPRSVHDTGVISAANARASRAGVEIGQPAREAARLMLLA